MGFKEIQRARRNMEKSKMIRLRDLIIEDYDPAQDKELWEMSESEFKDLIKSYESLRLKAYELGDGKITVGWGHAEDVGKSKYKVGQTISKAEAIRLFNEDYVKERNEIASLIPNWSSLPTYIKFALINTKFRGEFKNSYKWAKGIINNDWTDVAKNYSEGWGWPIPGGGHGTVAHRMTKNYNAFKKYANDATGTSSTDKLQASDFTIYPNPVSRDTELTIKVNTDKLPIAVLNITVLNSAGTKITTHAWNNISKGILQFQSPKNTGVYLVKITQAPDVMLRFTVQ